MKITAHSYRKALGAQLLCVATLLSAGHSAVGSPIVKDERQIKSELADLYRQHPYTFYCNCPFREGVPDLDACHYQIRKRSERARRIEWDHVVPASVIGKSMGCWHGQRRGQCMESSEAYRAAYLDLHNLQPSVGEINADRSDYTFGNVEAEPRQYGQCDVEIDFKNKIIEPRLAIRGDIARTYFYMKKQHGIPIPEDLLGLLKQWAIDDPVDDWERQRNQLIYDRTGLSNEWIGSVTDAAVNAPGPTDR